MKRVFDPGEMEMDVQSDPNRVIEIQEKVKILLGSNPQRQAGIRQEIIDEGAWALAGVINSTYVWMNKLEGNPPMQELLSDIMVKLVNDNEAAGNLLAKAGVLENPFEIPRSIAGMALKELDWKPNPEIQSQISKEINRQKKLRNSSWVFDLYQILLKSGSDTDFEGALKECNQWIKGFDPLAGKMLALLVNSYPGLLTKILTNVVVDNKELYKEKNIAELLVKALRPIPIEWLTKNILIQVTSDSLSKCKPPRHTLLEYLWTAAAQDGKSKFPDIWLNSIETIEAEMVKNNLKPSNDALVKESMYRYWFEALAFAKESQPIIKAALLSPSSNELWGSTAALQLFFGSYDSKFKNALEELKNSNYERFAMAEQKYNEIKSGRGKDGGEVGGEIGSSWLRDA